MGVIAGAFFLMSLRGIIPHFASIVVANTLGVAGVAILLRGIRAFQGVQRGGVWEWGAIIVTFPTFVYFTHISSDLNARIVFDSAIVALLMFRCSFLILADGPIGRRAAHLFSSAGFAVVAVSLSFLNVSTLMGVGKGAADASLFSPNAVIVIFLFIHVLGYVVFTLGLALLPGQRAQTELADEIAERKRAESDVREREAKYRSLVETSHDLIWSVDADGKITFVNEAGAQSILGYGLDEMVGKSFTFFVTPEQAEKDMKIFAETKKGGHRFNYETNFRAKDGTLVPININAAVVRDGDGNVVGASGTAQDLTEHNRMESQLRHAKKMEAVGQLTGGVAHEFNNLLQAIMANLQMARESCGDREKSAPLLDGAIAACIRGGNLTYQLLSFSRNQVLSSDVININDMLASFSGSLAGTLGVGISLKTEFADDLMPVEIDIDGIESALINLAHNSRLAMPDGGTITIGTAAVDLADAIHHEDGELPAGKYVVVDFSDTGYGMAPEVLERAFEPFFTTRDVGEGSGLGLSMVYGFAMQSDGHAAIESGPGSGTTVRMYLPIAKT
ncbi:MAG: PAS domain S-box protein [Rhodospirillales bacterium]|nr:PAS domain S-box protein [Rhodospirillales bacterium]